MRISHFPANLHFDDTNSKISIGFGSASKNCIEIPEERFHDLLNPFSSEIFWPITGSKILIIVLFLLVEIDTFVMPESVSDI